MAVFRIFCFVKNMSYFKIYSALPGEAASIRTKVFVEEQGFSDEFDDIDKTTKHIVMFDDSGNPMAACRYYFNRDYNAYSIGRIAVLKDYRGNHCGAAMLGEAERQIRSGGGGRIVVAAQLQAKEFYRKQGYTAFGEQFLEESCPHIMMGKTV